MRLYNITYLLVQGVYMDISTLSIVSVFLSTMLSLSLFLGYRYILNEAIKGVNYISFSLLALALSILPISLGYTQTSCNVIFLSHILYVIAFFLLILGISFIRLPKKSVTSFSSAISIITLLFFTYFTLIQPSINARIEIRSTFIIIMGLIGIYINKNGSVKDKNAPLLLLNLIFTVNIIAMMLRLIWVYTETPITHYLNISEVHKITYILLIVTTIAISFTVFWLLTERLISKIHNASITDELTNLYNRKGLKEFLAKHLPMKENTSISIILADIDKFKLINDTYGHDYGDLVIENFAKVIQEQCKNNEMCVRYGGDEFLIISQTSSLEASINITNKIQQSVSVQTIGSITYSVSFGLTEMTVNDDWNSLIKRVDSALYSAKEKGRGCLVQN